MQDLNETSDTQLVEEALPKPVRKRRPRAPKPKTQTPETTEAANQAADERSADDERRLVSPSSESTDMPHALTVDAQAEDPQVALDESGDASKATDSEEERLQASRSQRRRAQRRRAAARRAAEGTIIAFPAPVHEEQEPGAQTAADTAGEASEEVPPAETMPRMETAAEAPSAAPRRAAARQRTRKQPLLEKPVSAKQTPAKQTPAKQIDEGRLNVPPPFMHISEWEFAGVLDFYGIEWQYEPRSFPFRWEQGRVVEAFTPDFYMPQFDLYVELTTLKSGLRAEKNRKIRLLKEMYPEINIRLLHKAELFRFLTKYGYGPLGPEDVPDVHRILFPAARIQQRVAALGADISRDYAEKEPVLIGVLRGVVCFIGDLLTNISVPASLDFLAISSYGGPGAVKILKDLDENIKGRDVILVEDIVDTGLTLNILIEYLMTKRPASLKVCALLDKRIRRLTNVELAYVGFEIPDEFVVGYGLDFRQRYRNLPFIGALKHELLP